VFRTRSEFKADPDPAFQVNADPDADSDADSDADPDVDPDPDPGFDDQKFKTFTEKKPFFHHELQFTYP
jgi:hypothetical protein